MCLFLVPSLKNAIRRSYSDVSDLGQDAFFIVFLLPKSSVRIRKVIGLRVDL